MVDTVAIYIGCQIGVAVIGVVANFFVLTTILNTPSLHTVTNVLVANLALADMSVGLVAGPVYVVLSLGLPRDFTGCLVINSVIISLTNVSIMMLLVIALERFLATKAPFYYHSDVTMKKAYICNFCVWVVGIAVGSFPVVWSVAYRDLKTCYMGAVVSFEYMVYYRFFGLIIVPLFLMICIYVYILIVIRRHEREWEVLIKSIYANENSGSGRLMVVQKSTHFRRELRAAKLFAVIVLSFGVFWLPLNIFNSLYLLCTEGCDVYSKEALLLTMWMSHLNTCVNPFLYAASSTSISNAVKKRLGFEVEDEMTKYYGRPLLRDRMNLKKVQEKAPSAPSSTSKENKTKTLSSHSQVEVKSTAVP